MKKIKLINSLIALIIGVEVAFAEELNQNLINGAQAMSECNYSDAVKYLKEGAIEGDKYCCGRLALMYENGLGVDVNIPEARKWAMKGYKLGNSYSAAMLGYSYLLEYGMDNLDGLTKAMPYLEFAYNAEDREFDNADLYANTALLIATTKMETGNYQEGLSWLDQAIDDFPSYTPLLGQAAYCYWAIENYSKAVKYATLADKEDNPQGAFVLGWCMAYGEGITKNSEAGFKKIRKAANIGVPDYAMYALGECYYNGIGTPINKSLAKEWYQKAADTGIEEAEDKLNILF
ncbi:MAG: sel1 repeat family protein [Muribaculaceae bacterium]|nr:sel1 repeat family protein [Muribaculaceae bacterium]